MQQLLDKGLQFSASKQSIFQQSGSSSAWGGTMLQFLPFYGCYKYAAAFCIFGNDLEIGQSCTSCEAGVL
jgi:hypothetical protein